MLQTHLVGITDLTIWTRVIGAENLTDTVDLDFSVGASRFVRARPIGHHFDPLTGCETGDDVGVAIGSTDRHENGGANALFALPVITHQARCAIFVHTTLIGVLCALSPGHTLPSVAAISNFWHGATTALRGRHSAPQAKLVTVTMGILGIANPVGVRVGIAWALVTRTIGNDLNPRTLRKAFIVVGASIFTHRRKNFRQAHGRHPPASQRESGGQSALSWQRTSQ